MTAEKFYQLKCQVGCRNDAKALSLVNNVKRTCGQTHKVAWRTLRGWCPAPWPRRRTFPLACTESAATLHLWLNGRQTMVITTLTQKHRLTRNMYCMFYPTFKYLQAVRFSSVACRAVWAYWRWRGEGFWLLHSQTTLPQLPVRKVCEPQQLIQAGSWPHLFPLFHYLHGSQ